MGTKNGIAYMVPVVTIMHHWRFLKKNIRVIKYVFHHMWHLPKTSPPYCFLVGVSPNINSRDITIVIENTMIIET